MICATLVLASCANGSSVMCRCDERGCLTRCPPADGGGSNDASVPDDARAPIDASVPADAFVPPDVPGCVDADGDGHPSAACGGLDCDDTDPTRHPGAPERCQGEDDDCDARIDEGSFTAFFVGAGSTTWRSYELDCASSAAPAVPIQTVIDIESLSRAYFFTASTYHVLDLLTRSWIASGARATIMPETAGVPLLAGYTTPAGHAGGSATIETLYAASATNVYLYEIDIATPSTPTFRFLMSSGQPNPIPWTAPAGLLTAYQDVTGSWAPDPRAVCTEATYSAGPYSAYFTADRALIDDAGLCFMRIADMPIGSFAPFSYAGAPARLAWRHLLFNAGIWAFASPSF